MLNEYKTLTVTHKHVRLEKIADFMVIHSDEQVLQEKLNDLKAQFNLDELLYVATCNRVIYLYRSQEHLQLDFVQSFFQSVNQSLSADYIQRTVTAYEGVDAVSHLFEVSASIDSLVVGEREILRQIRMSFEKCENWGLTGKGIRLLMRHLVEASKEVYEKTSIGEKQVSVVSLAINLLLKSNLKKDQRIVLVGAGQTNRLVSKFLLKYNYSNVEIFNRSIDNANQLAQRFGKKGNLLSELENYREGFDCLIVCTGATHAIINADLYQKILNGERGQKMVIDLSVPNNVSREVVETFSVNYIEIEDLKELAEQNLTFRKKEISKAKVLLQQQIKNFERNFQHRQLTKALEHVPQEIKAIKERALNEVFKKDLDALDLDTRALVEKVITYMEKKCVSVPMKAAKKLVV